MAKNKGFIIVVDDDEGICRSLERLLAYHGYRAQAYSSPLDFLASKHLADATCLIVDVQMPQMNGLELQDRVRASGHLYPILFITGYLDDDVRKRALSGGAVDIIEKPFDDVFLIDKIEKALAGSETRTRH